MKMSAACLLAIFGAAACAAPGKPAPVEEDRPIGFARYCPGCERFVEASACPGCGRATVALEACVMPWYWCGSKSHWRRQPCDRHARTACCRRHESTALQVAADDPDLTFGIYCPEDGMFCGRSCPTDARGDCRACGKRPTLALFVRRTWYGCEAHDAWHVERCAHFGPEDGGAARTVRMLACPCGPAVEPVAGAFDAARRGRPK